MASAAQTPANSDMKKLSANQLAILMQASEMKVNNASLTGESEDLLRDPSKKTRNIFESSNVAFFGTSCTAGVGIGIVFKTGDNTVIGQIANLA